mmetsp:Transcript_17786/g.55734  ORF Transcript_17786/g.55734 Transcript_17786/m.55734 type:complete len:236 (-) Transcript_17786:257-964(-)
MSAQGASGSVWQKTCSAAAKPKGVTSAWSLPARKYFRRRESLGTMATARSRAATLYVLEGEVRTMRRSRRASKPPAKASWPSEVNGVASSSRTRPDQTSSLQTAATAAEWRSTRRASRSRWDRGQTVPVGLCGLQRRTTSGRVAVLRTRSSSSRSPAGTAISSLQSRAAFRNGGYTGTGATTAPSRPTRRAAWYSPAMRPGWKRSHRSFASDAPQALRALAQIASLRRADAVVYP